MQAENRGQAQGQGGLAAAIIGGVIGAAVGVGLHTLLETTVLRSPGGAAWFAIAIGLLTGLGVRMASGAHLERSYVRGAASALIALAAIVASSFVIKEVMKRREVAVKSNTAPVAAAEEADADDAESAKSDDDDKAPVVAVNDPASPIGGAIGTPKAGAGEVNLWQFIFMALGGLVAYEFGRGADPARHGQPLPDEPAEGLGRATDPSE